MDEPGSRNILNEGAAEASTGRGGKPLRVCGNRHTASSPPETDEYGNLEAAPYGAGRETDSGDLPFLSHGKELPWGRGAIPKAVS